MIFKKRTVKHLRVDSPPPSPTLNETAHSSGIQTMRIQRHKLQSPSLYRLWPFRTKQCLLLVTGCLYPQLWVMFPLWLFRLKTFLQARRGKTFQYFTIEKKKTIEEKKQKRNVWKHKHNVVGRVSFLLRVPIRARPPPRVINSLTSPHRCGWREASSDKKARAGQRSGRFQHQDATPHPHRAAQRQSRQPGEEEPQEEGGRHRHHNLLPVGRRQLHVCMVLCDGLTALKFLQDL